MKMGCLEETVSILRLQCQRRLAQELPKLGWSTPNSYSDSYRAVGNFAGVYFFSDFDFYEGWARVLYIGQSRNVKTRWARHLTLREIEKSHTSVCKWFLPLESKTLRESERFLISELNPPFNIIGRRRGVL